MPVAMYQAASVVAHSARCNADPRQKRLRPCLATPKKLEPPQTLLSNISVVVLDPLDPKNKVAAAPTTSAPTPPKPAKRPGGGEQRTDLHFPR